MVWAWIGVGVSYFSSVSARRIGSARPKSLNEVKEALFYMANQPPRSCEQRNRGVLKTSRVARVVGSLEKRKRRGEDRKAKFVHAARKPEIGSIRSGHMTGGCGIFKASFIIEARDDE